MVINVPTKRRVKKAGEILADDNSDEQSRDDAMSVLSEWRMLHYHPINAFRSLLGQRCKKLFGGNNKILIAQRLKRTPSIIRKLQRFPRMDLSQMQDIGGLRVVVPKIADVYKLRDTFIKNRRTAHEIIKEDDYIATPKNDGYRSLHLVFKYSSKQKPELNGLRIELQIRTKLQHAWATAVETLGIIERASFKTGEGSEVYKDFFRICGDIFAAEDHGEKPKIEQLEMLKKLNEELRVTEKLRGIAAATFHIDSPKSKNGYYYLIKLDMSLHRASITPFTKNQFDVAETLYKAMEEKLYNDPDNEVVMVSVDNIKEIKSAYPNYFLDTRNFSEKVDELIIKLMTQTI